MSLKNAEVSYLEYLIGRLQMDIRGMLLSLEPTTLEKALKLARPYEQTLSSNQRGITIPVDLTSLIILKLILRKGLPLRILLSVP